MAKSTHAQEASTGDSASFNEHELSDPAPPPQVVITRLNLGGEPPSSPETGVSYTPSSRNELSASESQTPNPPKPAPVTEPPSNHSGESQGDGDVLSGADGSTPETEMESDDEVNEEVSTEDTESETSTEETRPKPKPRAKRAPAKPKDTSANVRSTEDDPFGEF